MKPIDPARLGASVLLMLYALSACASPPVPLSGTLSLREAMNAEGVAERIDPVAAPRTVIIMRDRHPTYRGYRRIRSQLVEVQRSNRRFLDYAVRSGYSLLGCEFPNGPLEENDDTRQSYQIIRSKLRYGPRYLDRFAVYQPVRYQLFWPDTLLVRGVEDKALYEGDRAILKEYQHIRGRLTRGGLRSDEKITLERATLNASSQLQVNSDRRGTAAATNLLRTMEKTNRHRAVLLLGGAHVPAAYSTLKQASIQVHVFCPNGYRDEL